MATTSPLVTLVHATDAPQHLAELKTILERLKSDERISDFTSTDASLKLPASLGDSNNNGVIVMLTHDLQQLRAGIERSLREKYSGEQNLKFIEIIVDNVPYNNDFITFPDDRKPTRSREDMDAVRRGIERNLALMFPKPTRVPEKLTPTRSTISFLPLIGIAIGIFLVTIAFLWLFQIVFQQYLPEESSYYSDYYRPYHFKLYENEYGGMLFFHLLFSTIIPFLIFFIKPLQSSLGIAGNNKADWRPFLKASLYGVLVFFASLTFVFILFANDILPPAMAVLLPPLITLVMLGRRKQEVSLSSTEHGEIISEIEVSKSAAASRYLKIAVIGTLVFYVVWKLITFIVTETFY